jgi:hypothetical protein
MGINVTNKIFSKIIFNQQIYKGSAKKNEKKKDSSKGNVCGKYCKKKSNFRVAKREFLFIFDFDIS